MGEGMGRFLFLSAIPVVALVSTFPANAADVPDGAPVQAMAPLHVHDWTGFYVGANAGGVLGDADISWTAPGLGFSTHGAADVNASGTGHTSAGGITSGGQVGYNQQFRSIFLGAEADFGYAGGSRPRVRLLQSLTTIPMRRWSAATG
jgi:outer membrane immunogenic protein